MQVDGAAAPGTADFSRIIAAASTAVLQGGVPAEASAAAAAAQTAAAEAPERAAVHCPVTGRWSHLSCFPAGFAEQLRHVAFTQPCISSQVAATTSQRLAVVCAAGLLPLGSIAEGARAGAAGGSAAADAGSGSSGFVPLPLSLLVVRGTAVASPADCRGHSPAYAPEQRRQLQVALSAALQVLHRWAGRLAGQLPCKCMLQHAHTHILPPICSRLGSQPKECHTSMGCRHLTCPPRSLLPPYHCSCYDPLPDSRTGADMVPWLLRGAVLAGGRADYSAAHTALLYAGRAVVGVGEQGWLAFSRAFVCSVAGNLGLFLVHCFTGQVHGVG